MANKAIKKIPESAVVEVTRTSRHIEDKSHLDALLSRATGLDLKGYQNQNSLLYEYGYARVILHGNGSYTCAQGWREISEPGEAWAVRGEPETVNFNNEHWLSDLVIWAGAILRTGRTLACGKGIGLYERNRRNPTFGTCDYPWDTILAMVEGTYEHQKFDLNPDYQRGAVWTERQQQEFVGFLLDGGDCHKIVVQRYETAKNAPATHKDTYYELPAEVVDGQQRLRAVCAWLRGKICAITPEGDRLWFKDTNEVDRRGLMLKIHYVDLPRVERLRFYIKLNRGGTVHTEQEIVHVQALLDAEKGK